MRILVLGGTSEARRLADLLAGRPGLDVLMSLAGRTQAPMDLALPVRIGGFGGAEGLAAFLREGGFDLLVDATHPFARQISANALAASTVTGLPLLTLARPGWEPVAGDRWIEVPDMAAAALALGTKPKRVFLTTGRLGLAAFKANPVHDYLLRSIDPPADADLPRHCRVLLARGPFTLADEIALMRGEGIEVLVSKNSGGPMTQDKITAARALGVPVVMVARGDAVGGSTFATPEALAAHLIGLG